MSRAYLTEKQMPRTCWYFTIKHSARIMNMIPGKYRGKLASPFMLIHGVCPDPRTWLSLFLLCYFHHDKDTDAPSSNNQAHTLDGIVIRQSSTLNALLVYNPQNQQYYEPDSYRLNSYHLPSLVYPSIVYNGGLFVSLHRDGSIPASKPYPPGTRVIKTDPDTNVTLSGTVMDIPINPTTTPHYLIQFDNSTTSSIPASKCNPLSLSPPLICWKAHTSYLPSSIWIRKSHLNMKDGITRVSKHNHRMGFTALAINPTLTRSIQTRAFHFQI